MAHLLPRTIVVCLLLGLVPARGEVVFLGPTPYLSTVDSPFDMSGIGSTFFFEDFEDGSFDLPPGVTSYPYVLNAPSPTTDSVDADDGLLDGVGRDGWSLTPVALTTTFSNPPYWVKTFRLRFDESVLGYLPDSFGFVWTDGVSSSRLSIQVEYPDGSRAFTSFGPLMDELDSGHTVEDRFIGVRSTIPFEIVRVSNSYYGHNWINQFEMDHIQFGRFVPEPEATVIVAVLICAWQFWRLLHLRS